MTQKYPNKNSRGYLKIEDNSCLILSEIDRDFTVTENLFVNLLLIVLRACLGMSKLASAFTAFRSRLWVGQVHRITCKLTKNETLM